MHKSFVFCLTVILFSCSHRTTSVIKGAQKEFLTNFSLNSNPNNLDTVGIIFSIDNKGNKTAIANLNVNTSSDIIVVPKEIDSSKVSYRMILDFLKIKALDSSAQAGFNDSVTLLTNFKVESGIQSRFDLNADLDSLFKIRSKVIAKNIKFLDLDKNKLYLIIETVRSNEVNFSNIKSVNAGFNVKAKLFDLIQANPNYGITKKSDNSIAYKLNNSLVVFYKLRRINAEVIETKGDENIIAVTLGPVEMR